MKNIKKNISMMCSVCGNDQFSTIDEEFEDLQNAPENTEVKCADCGRITTKEQLIEENSEIIDANIEELKEDVVKQLQKDLRKIFK